MGGDWPAHWPEPLRRAHAARGSTGPDAAQPRLASLLPPAGMLGLDAAATLLRDAIAADRRIVVTADFDCDGATACAVALRGLRMLGARHVDFAVPDRQMHGYGLTPALVATLEPLQPDLLVTVDHGIACHAGIAAAKARGWQVIVTDHHLPGLSLPDADAIVDPNQPGDAFPSKALAGVGVLFYLLLALRAQLGVKADLASLLDLVAVGTVADMVPLDANNRALVGAGLRRLRAGQGGAGLNALAAVAGRNIAALTTADIGFAIGPRINAAGRLEDMRLGIECLLTDDAVQARGLAEALHAINAERRGLQDEMLAAADAAMSRVDTASDNAEGFCLFDSDWHPGVIGLVASRIKEQRHRPVLAFAPSGNDDGMLRGSMRSIPGFHARDALALIDARHPGLVDRFGGHAMAAGLSLPESALPAFRDAFAEVLRGTLDPAVLQECIDSDGELPLGALDIAHAQALRDGGAWGQGYPEPLFDGVFDVLDWRVLGGKHLKLELGLEGRRLNAIHFNAGGDAPPARVRIAYRLQPDDYRGGEAIQLVVVHREAEPPSVHD
ncbi:MAG: single-stranded-DNA-specific exonuclease RecJ [Thermomonas sp.]